MKRLFLVLAIATAGFLPACTMLGLATPETFAQKLAVGYATVTEARTVGTKLLVAKKISVADAENIQEQADVARKGLDVAREISKTSPTAADSKLSSVTAGLRALQTYLASKQ